jgi:hypothetical protein
VKKKEEENLMPDGMAEEDVRNKEEMPAKGK